MSQLNQISNGYFALLRRVTKFERAELAAVHFILGYCFLGAAIGHDLAGGETNKLYFYLVSSVVFVALAFLVVRGESET